MLSPVQYHFNGTLHNYHRRQWEIMATSPLASGRYIFWRSESVLKPNNIYVDIIMCINIILTLTIMMKMPYFADKMYLRLM
jgi:hypothetical protein